MSISEIQLKQNVVQDIQYPKMLAHTLYILCASQPGSDPIIHPRSNESQ